MFSKIITLYPYLTGIDTSALCV